MNQVLLGTSEYGLNKSNLICRAHVSQFRIPCLMHFDLYFFIFVYFACLYCVASEKEKAKEKEKKKGYLHGGAQGIVDCGSHP